MCWSRAIVLSSWHSGWSLKGAKTTFGREKGQQIWWFSVALLVLVQSCCRVHQVPAPGGEAQNQRRCSALSPAFLPAPSLPLPSIQHVYPHWHRFCWHQNSVCAWLQWPFSPLLEGLTVHVISFSSAFTVTHGRWGRRKREEATSQIS